MKYTKIYYTIIMIIEFLYGTYSVMHSVPNSASSFMVGQFLGNRDILQYGLVMNVVISMATTVSCMNRCIYFHTSPSITMICDGPIIVLLSSI